MCDFDDDFGDGDFMDNDSFEDRFEDETMDDDFSDGSGTDDQDFDGPDSDEFAVKDAFFIGAIVGNVYEEGLDERKRRELLRRKRTKRDPTSD